MFEITDNYLAASEFLGPALSGISGIAEARLLDDLKDLEDAQFTPALFYLYYGDNVADTTNAGANQQLKQTWLVVLVNRRGNEAESGKIIAETIRTLAGKVTGQVGPWQRINTPIKPLYVNGFSFFPLAFTSQMRMRGNR